MLGLGRCENRRASPEKASLEVQLPCSLGIITEVGKKPLQCKRISVVGGASGRSGPGKPDVFVMADPAAHVRDK